MNRFRGKGLVMFVERKEIKARNAEPDASGNWIVEARVALEKSDTHVDLKLWENDQRPKVYDILKSLKKGDVVEFRGQVSAHAWITNGRAVGRVVCKPVFVTVVGHEQLEEDEDWGGDE